MKLADIPKSIALVIGATVSVAVFPCSIAMAQSVAGVTSKVTPASPEAWRKVMKANPPSSPGCFTATYPQAEWQRVQCRLPPNRPFSNPPRHGDRQEETVGDGTDYSAVVSSGAISSSEGSFNLVSDVTSETDSGSNIFSLQLNSQLFTTTACGGVVGCLGWEQFVYSSNTYNGAFIQSWLISYGPTCPVGWTYAGSDNCYHNSSIVSVPSQAITNLRQITLTGTASSGSTDAVIISTGTNLYSETQADSVVNLASAWTTSEFNVFGDGGGTTATFNTGATIVVRTSVNNGTTNSPSCSESGTTGEKNSLTLVPPCCPIGGAVPGIIFMESSAAGASTSCALLKSTWLAAVVDRMYN
jgi:hypothetical protein